MSQPPNQQEAQKRSNEIQAQLNSCDQLIMAQRFPEANMQLSAAEQLINQYKISFMMDRLNKIKRKIQFNLTVLKTLEDVPDEIAKDLPPDVLQKIAIILDQLWTKLQYEDPSQSMLHPEVFKKVDRLHQQANAEIKALAKASAGEVTTSQILGTSPSLASNQTPEAKGKVGAFFGGLKDKIGAKGKTVKFAYLVSAAKKKKNLNAAKIGITEALEFVKSNPDAIIAPEKMQEAQQFYTDIETQIAHIMKETTNLISMIKSFLDQNRFNDANNELSQFNLKIAETGLEESMQKIQQLQQAVRINEELFNQLQPLMNMFIAGDLLNVDSRLNEIKQRIVAMNLVEFLTDKIRERFFELDQNVTKQLNKSEDILKADIQEIENEVKEQLNFDQCQIKIRLIVETARKRGLTSVTTEVNILNQKFDQNFKAINEYKKINDLFGQVRLAEAFKTIESLWTTMSNSSLLFFPKITVEIDKLRQNIKQAIVAEEQKIKVDLENLKPIIEVEMDFVKARSILMEIKARCDRAAIETFNTQLTQILQRIDLNKQVQAFYQNIISLFKLMDIQNAKAQIQQARTAFGQNPELYLDKLKSAIDLIDSEINAKIKEQVDALEIDVNKINELFAALNFVDTQKLLIEYRARALKLGQDALLQKIDKLEAKRAKSIQTQIDFTQIKQKYDAGEFVVAKEAIEKIWADCSTNTELFVDQIKENVKGLFDKISQELSENKIAIEKEYDLIQQNEIMNLNFNDATNKLNELGRKAEKYAIKDAIDKIIGMIAKCQENDTFLNDYTQAKTHYDGGQIKDSKILLEKLWDINSAVADRIFKNLAEKIQSLRDKIIQESAEKEKELNTILESINQNEVLNQKYLEALEKLSDPMKNAEKYGLENVIQKIKGIQDKCNANIQIVKTLADLKKKLEAGQILGAKEGITTLAETSASSELIADSVKKEINEFKSKVDQEAQDLEKKLGEERQAVYENSVNKLEFSEAIAKFNEIIKSAENYGAQEMIQSIKEDQAICQRSAQAMSELKRITASLESGQISNAKQGIEPLLDECSKDNEILEVVCEKIRAFQEKLKQQTNSVQSQIENDIKNLDENEIRELRFSDAITKITSMGQSAQENGLNDFVAPLQALLNKCQENSQIFVEFDKIVKNYNAGFFIPARQAVEQLYIGMNNLGDRVFENMKETVRTFGEKLDQELTQMRETIQNGINQITPEQLKALKVAEINQMFSEANKLIEKYGFIDLKQQLDAKMALSGEMQVLTNRLNDITETYRKGDLLGSRKKADMMVADMQAKRDQGYVGIMDQLSNLKQMIDNSINEIPIRSREMIQKILAETDGKNVKFQDSTKRLIALKDQALKINNATLIMEITDAINKLNVGVQQVLASQTKQCPNCGAFFDPSMGEVKICYICGKKVAKKGK